jgi:hypothetical protein
MRNLIRRAGNPGEADLRCCAYHGPGHEIVKKPFAAPVSGDVTMAENRPVTENISLSGIRPTCLTAPDYARQARQRSPTERVSS